MDHPIPEWLNEAFLSNCLQGKDHDASSVIVTSYNVTAGVAPGNNYGSEILRVKVEYKEDKSNQCKCISLIIKAPVTNCLVDSIIELFGMAEYNFYYIYLPTMNDIIKEHITAQAFFTSMKSVIVLEDLKDAGFVMADRQKQLDLSHCEQYFKASAKFHAAGVFIAEQNPELLETFPGVFERMIKSGDFSQMDMFMHDILVGCKCLVKSISELNLDDYKPYIDIIKTFIELNMDSREETKKIGFQALTEMNKKLFKSFIHGDCWTTNMMFKHNESGDPTEIRLIDFQGFRYDSVISDLVNFTWMSCNNEVLEHHLDELYRLYCETLNSKLEELGCTERLPLERLKEEICGSGFQVFSMVCVMLPLTQHDDLIDTTKMFTGKVTEEDIMKYYRGENFYRKFPQVLKFVANQGIFDRMEKELQQWKLLGDQINSS